MAECIHGAVEPTVIEAPKAKRYISRHPGNLPPSYSTFNTKNTNLVVNNIGGHRVLHRGYLKTHALWGKPKFEAEPEPIFPVGLVKPARCEMKQPEIWKHMTFKADPDKYKEYLEKKPKRRPKTAQPRQTGDLPKREDFGKVPEYLEKMKREREAKEVSEARRKLEEEQEAKKKKPTKYDLIQLVT